MVLEEEDFVIAREEHGHLLYEKTFSSPTYCTICNGFIWGLRKQGLACELCGMVLHDKCKAKAEEKPCYSPEFVPNDQSEVLFLHHWVEVNTRGKCIVCSKSKLANNNSTTPSGFINARCIGCSKYVHLNCLPAHKDHGTGGYCTPTHRNLFLVSEIPMTIPTYKPLLVFINAKSGGQQGLHVLRALRGLLTRNQVISLLDESPGNPFLIIILHANANANG
jgi:diacylglycerol kinase (ATP)